jgi:hypothetical protein
VRRLLPFLIVALATAWATSMHWRSPGFIFATRLSGDSLHSAYFYDYVGRSLAAGLSLENLGEFDYPTPLPMGGFFPTTLEAEIMAPVVQALGWPGHWSAILSLTVLGNALAMAFLARVLGCGAAGTVFAGLATLCLRPLWSDLALGRMNAASPGYALLAMALALQAFPAGPFKGRRGLPLRLVSAVLAVPAGYAAALVYPPFVLLLIPVGICLAGCSLRRSRGRGLALPLSAAASAYFLAKSGLEAIPRESTMGFTCGQLGCVSDSHVADLAGFFLQDIPGLAVAGIHWVLWPMAGFALVRRGLRTSAAMILALTGLFALLSAGPCPKWAGQAAAGWWFPYLEPLICLSMELHDFRRFLLIVALTLALLAAIGLDGAPRPLRWRKWFVLPLFALALGWMGKLSYMERMSPWVWHRLEAPPIVSEVVGIGEVAVELPFDRKSQYLSALYAPGRYRVNPFHLVSTGNRDPFAGWLQQLGQGKLPPNTPTKEEVAASGVNWVLYDLHRCEETPNPRVYCDMRIRTALISLLGYPAVLEGVSIWQLSED